MSGLRLPHKRNLHLKWWLVGAVVVVLLVAGSYLTYRWYTTGKSIVSVPKAYIKGMSLDESSVSQSDLDNYASADNEPKYISIPALNLDTTRVRAVGLDVNNFINYAKNIHDVAWYNESTKPGQGYGAVAINGANNGSKTNGAFYNLDYLKANDKITITTGNNKLYTYHVVKRQIMSLSEFAKNGMKLLMTPRSSDIEGLNLVTYAGEWVPRDKQYTQRVIVFAEADKATTSSTTSN